MVASLTERMLRSMDTLQNFIDGRWTDAPERAPAINPATGQQIAWLPKSDRAIAREGIAAELVRQMKGETLPAEDPTKLVMTLRQPRGVYAVITPWNYPVNIPVEYLGPGLATGNTIVWVPAPTTSMAAVELMRAIEAAGLPAG